MKGNTIMKTASVVVTYNRKELLAKNIRMQLLQSKEIETIIIVDNHGSDGSKKNIKTLGLMTNKIKYLYLEDNIGGAGGFSVGVQTAYDMGYDFIWLMDDDGSPYDETTFENIYECAICKYNHNKLLMFNSLVIAEDGKLSFTLNGTKDVDTALSRQSDDMINDAISPFNGTLISKELVAKIGVPNKDFFIKGDETDYTMRARKAGAFIATVVTSVYTHPSLKMEEVCIGPIKKNVGLIESAWKEYYRSRNYTYMYVRDNKRVKAFAMKCLRIYVAHKHNANKETIRMIKLGYKDGIKGKLGITIKP